MSRYFSSKYSALKPYAPGEQPRDKRYIKLNTNESPFPPSQKAQKAALAAAENLQLYSDPECTALTEKMAELYGLSTKQVFFGNGSDEVLYLAFLAFCEEGKPVYFPDITYGFYKVYADFLGLDAVQIPLCEDFSVNVEDYLYKDGPIFIANPNAPTGKLLSLQQVEKIVKTNKDYVVVIDEAYIDFGGESAVKLIDKYNNLLVTQTFSKSRSLAGGRLGMGFANKELITDLRTAKYSINPYNVNAMTMAAGLGALEDEECTRKNCQTIVENRAYTTAELKKLGFTVLDSMTNFVLAGSPAISGKDLYEKLKNKGILVRYFATERLSPYVRITIGTKSQMETMLTVIKEILEEAV